jgi:hypothetical protein
MENQNDEKTYLVKENNVQDQSQNNQSLEKGIFNVKDNIKISEDNKKDNNEQIITNNNNEELALNIMEIEKTQQDNINNENGNNQEENENKKERSSLIRLPLAKIKNIMKRRE